MQIVPTPPHQPNHASAHSQQPAQSPPQLYPVGNSPETNNLPPPSVFQSPVTPMPIMRTPITPNPTIPDRDPNPAQIIIDVNPQPLQQLTPMTPPSSSEITELVTRIGRYINDHRGHASGGTSLILGISLVIGGINSPPLLIPGIVIGIIGLLILSYYSQQDAERPTGNQPPEANRSPLQKPEMIAKLEELKKAADKEAALAIQPKEIMDPTKARSEIIDLLGNILPTLTQENLKNIYPTSDIRGLELLSKDLGEIKRTLDAMTADSTSQTIPETINKLKGTLQCSIYMTPLHIVYVIAGTSKAVYSPASVYQTLVKSQKPTDPMTRAEIDASHVLHVPQLDALAQFLNQFELETTHPTP